MTTHQFVYQTFVLYICLKAAILLPLAWFTFLVRRAERKIESQSLASTAPQTVVAIAGEPLVVDTPALHLPEAA